MARPRHRRTVALALAACAAMSLGACGSTRVVGSPRSVGIALSEYAVKPNSIRVGPGLLTIIVHNYGARTHNLVVSLNGKSIGATKPLYPGQKDRITVALVPGRYMLASTILNDKSLGAYGTLVVPAR